MKYLISIPIPGLKRNRHSFSYISKIPARKGIQAVFNEKKPRKYFHLSSE